MSEAALDLQLADTIVLKKPHPCGSKEWTVTRLGADISLKCLGCDRDVLMSRADLGRRIKGLFRSGQPLLV